MPPVPVRLDPAPAIRATVVGSFPGPLWWLASGSQANLQDAIMVVLKIQELAGLDVISDGELSRFDPGHPETNGMIDHFIRPLDGVRTAFTAADRAVFKSETRLAYRTQPAGVVEGPIGPGTLNLPAEFARVRALTDRPLKFAITSPYMLARVLLDRHYGDSRALTMALAEVLRQQVEEIDASVLQVDEAHLTGHPEDWPWALEAINHVLAGARGEAAVHLCFGNYGGQSVQQGFWRDLLPFLDGLAAGHVVLEFARRGYDELDAFRGLSSGLQLGLGVVDVKDNEVESPDTIARRIEHAVDVLGADRIAWIHPDCGLWMLHRTVAERKLRALVQGRDLYLGSHR